MSDDVDVLDRKQMSVFVLVISILFLTLFVVLHIWVNHERIQLQYEINELQKELAVVEEAKSRLIIEKDFLLAPRQLERKARELGLHNAKPGQIRTIIKDEVVGILIEDNVLGE